MKVIENKRTTIEAGDENGGVTLLTYANLIGSAIRQIRQEGFTIGEMKMCFNILEASEKADGEISLEDAEFEYLKRKIPGTRWLVLNKDIITFEDDINAIK